MLSSVARIESSTCRRRLAIGSIVIVANACQAARVVTNRCESPYVSGTGTLQVTEGTTTRQFTLAGEGGRVGSDRFDLVRAALLDGSAPADTGIAWALASGDGARLVVTHRSRLSAGERLTVDGPPGRRDWGVGPAPRPGAALVALILPNTPTGSAVTGTIEVLRVTPLELRLELRSSLSDGGSTQAAISGTVRFRRATEERPCFS